LYWPGLTGHKTPPDATVATGLDLSPLFQCLLLVVFSNIGKANCDFAVEGAVENQNN